MTVSRMMMFVAIVMLGAFLGILIWKVQRVDLAGVVALTFALAIWDSLTWNRH